MWRTNWLNSDGQRSALNDVTCCFVVVFFFTCVLNCVSSSVENDNDDNKRRCVYGEKRKDHNTSKRAYSGFEKGRRGCVRFENNNYHVIVLRYIRCRTCVFFSKAKELGCFVSRNKTAIQTGIIQVKRLSCDFEL